MSELPQPNNDASEEKGLVVVGDLLQEYIDWMYSDGKKGKGPDELLALELTRAQRSFLQYEMDKILIFYGESPNRINRARESLDSDE